MYQYHLKSNRNPELLLVIKTAINFISTFLVCAINTARLVDLRSRATLKILDARVNSIETRNSSNQDLLDRIIEHSDYAQSLANNCVPDNFKWIDVQPIMHQIVQSSLNSSESFTIDFNDIKSKCICKILNKTCTHFTETPHFPNFNFCLNYWPSRMFMEFSFVSLEEYYTKIYLTYMNKLQFNHNFLPVDVIVSPNQVVLPFLSAESLSNYSSNAKPFNEFRGHPYYTSYTTSLLQRYSEIDGSGIAKSSNAECLLYRNSLPTLEVNSLSIDSSLEESQVWIKLAIQLAYHSQDPLAVINATSVLIRNYLFVANDYKSGIDELDKLIRFQYNVLSLMPRSPINFVSRRTIQAFIVRNKSMLIQYKKHLLAGLSTPFYPAQLTTTTISFSLIFLFFNFRWISA